MAAAAGSLQLGRVKVMFLIITERAFTMLRGYLRLDELPRTIARECRPLPFYLYAVSTARVDRAHALFLA